MKILETTALSNEIEKLINESNEFTIIVSPYLKINNRLRPKLADCFIRNKKNLILYRENELTNEERKWLEHSDKVTLLPIKNLHAKCYLNERTALIASMNLYDYSQINNHEIGIRVSIDNEKEHLEELIKIVHGIIKQTIQILTLPITRFLMKYIRWEIYTLNW